MREPAPDPVNGRDVRYDRFGNTGLGVRRRASGAMTFRDYDFNSFKASVDPATAREP